MERRDTHGVLFVTSELLLGAKGTRLFDHPYA